MKNKNLLIGLISVVVIAGAYFYYKAKKNNTTLMASENISVAPLTTESPINGFGDIVKNVYPSSYDSLTKTATGTSRENPLRDRVN